ncbi:ABC transporter substrate-binding protein [Lacticaseibacillus jixiensis]|uniref:ABC transporter substrate-binding protein n=1 Tax=Lacticaseibacillus jixiensis TaxID=3231926 RepID=UPI0036F42DF8
MHIRTFIIAAAATLLLAGCAPKHTTSSQSATRTVTTTAGKTQIPAHPKRVVSTVYTGELLSLGVPVVGSTQMDLQNPWLSKSATKGIKDLGNAMNQEAILKLKPDLIVTSNEADVKKLKAIAPVLYIPYGSTGDMYQTLTTFGTWFGKTAQAKTVAADLKATAKTAVTQLKAGGIDPAVTTVSFFDIQASKLYVDGATWGRGGNAIVTAMGFKLNAASQKVEVGTGYKQISTESLTTYAGDWMFFSNTTTTANGNDQAISDLKHNAVWQQLPAVKAGHVVALPFTKMYYYDPAAIKGQIKLVAKTMLKQQ